MRIAREILRTPFIQAYDATEFGALNVSRDSGAQQLFPSTRRENDVPRGYSRRVYNEYVL